MEYGYDKLNEWHYKPIENPIGYIVYTHLLVEHALNYIAFRNLSDFNKFVNLKFSQKTQKLFEKQLIPEWLYYNINKLNKFRNRLVHDLEIDFSSIDLELKTLSGHSVPLNDLIDNNKTELIILIINIIGQKIITPINSLVAVEYLHKDKY